MLKHTFCHIPRIGVGTEERYWNLGIHTWADAAAGGDKYFGAKAAWIRDYLAQSEEHLAAGNAKWFDDLLPSNQGWRLFGDFRDRIAYVDIETTGLGQDEDHITTIALYDGDTVKTYVHGKNLGDFEADIARYGLLVTFNGKCFDAPFIERHFNMKLDMAHIDLRFVMKRLDYTGGLKAIEKRLGLSRDELDGVDGYFAVILWNEYQNTGNPAALETLLAYNAADVVGLEPLLVHAWNTLAAKTPHGPANQLPMPLEPAPVPHTPDPRLVHDLRRRHGLFG